MGYREDCYGRGLALHGDKTTTGASCISSPGSSASNFMLGVVRVGDVTTICPKCGKRGRIIDGEAKAKYHGTPAAVDRSVVLCDCPKGSNRIIAPAGQWIGSGPSPEQRAQEKHAAMLLALKTEQEAEETRKAEERERSRVFAKSCLRDEGCNDAGTQQEPHTNFADMGLFCAAPEHDSVTDSEAPQYAQTAKKKPVAPEDIPKPKKRSALYRWWNGGHDEMDYQAAVAAAASATRAQTATAGVNVLEQIAGRFSTYGTWAVRGGSNRHGWCGGLSCRVFSRYDAGQTQRWRTGLY